VGTLQLLPPTDQVLAFERVDQGETLVCLFNFSDRVAEYRVAAGAAVIPERSVGSGVEGGWAQLGPCGMLFARAGQLR